MIRLNFNPSIIKNLCFNEKDKTLEIEFKRNIKTAQHIKIPLSILEEYVESLKQEEIIENVDPFQSNLKIVYSNFKSVS